jgi:molybdopterin-binding protein
MEDPMRLSTRNQFAGKVVSITTGEAMAIVKIALDDTDLVMTSAVTKDAVDELGLKVGSSAYALVKATEVQLAVD